MKLVPKIAILLCFGIAATSCVTKKKFISLQSEMEMKNKELDRASLDLGKCNVSVNDSRAKLSACENENGKLRGDMKSANAPTWRSWSKVIPTTNR